jgi:hypothetical protein
MVPLGWMYSSLTGMGSETSQSSSLMCRGLPVSSETILVHRQYTRTFSPTPPNRTHLSQVYSAHQTRFLISVSNGPYGPPST